MKLKATHDSGTGEPSKGLLSIIGIPFARCQSLTLKEQFEKGVRLFDLRAKKINGEYIIGHGLWKSSTSLREALITLGTMAAEAQESTYVLLTYEGKLKTKEDEDEFARDMEEMTVGYPLIVSSINVKLPEWKCIKNIHPVYYKQSYVKIVGWKAILPIPWLWWAFGKKNVFTEEYYTMVDFV